MREVKVSSGTITIYQPQIESREKNSLKGRAAIAYNKPGSEAPVFGVTWFNSRAGLEVDCTVEVVGLVAELSPEQDEHS